MGEEPPSAFIVRIPKGVTSIGKFAFVGCTDLMSVSIPDSITEIKDLTFCNCKHLTNVIIPASVTKIGYRPFLCCTGLMSVVIHESAPEIIEHIFPERVEIIRIQEGGRQVSGNSVSAES